LQKANQMPHHRPEAASFAILVALIMGAIGLSVAFGYVAGFQAAALLGYAVAAQYAVGVFSGATALLALFAAIERHTEDW